MKLKKLLAILTLAFIAASPASLNAQTNIENDPAYLPIDKAFDFKTLKPEVNINLPQFLLKDLLSDLDGGKNDPFAGSGVNISELIQDIKLIRVVVMEKADNEAVTKGIETLKSTLEKKWTPIANVGEQNEQVGVYAISDSTGQSIAGLAVLVHEGHGDTVIANIVGRVSIGKIVKAASQMNKFPKDLLKKLTDAAGAAGGGAVTNTDASAEKPKDVPEKSAK